MTVMIAPLLFSTLTIGMMPAYLICESAEGRSQGQWSIQVATTLDGVREFFNGLENGDGTAFFEGVRHQKQPLDESLTSNDSS
jgi:hypothetical protein